MRDNLSPPIFATRTDTFYQLLVGSRRSNDLLNKTEMCCFQWCCCALPVRAPEIKPVVTIVVLVVRWWRWWCEHAKSNSLDDNIPQDVKGRVCVQPCVGSAGGSNPRTFRGIEYEYAYASPTLLIISASLMCHKVHWSANNNPVYRSSGALDFRFCFKLAALR